ncbi:MAG: hypothetical protein Q4A48_07450 [Bacillota bacterium]|nr:hypothetical protein [Bacillota bacterium]
MEKELNKEHKKREEIALIVSYGILLTAIFCLLIMMTGVRKVTPFAFGLPAVFIVLSLIKLWSRKAPDDSGKAKNGKAFYIAAGAVGAAAVIALVTAHSEIFDGAKLLLNSLYKSSEATQAYVYEQYDVSRDPGSYMFCMRAAILWIGCLIGALTAFIPVRFFRWTGVAFAAIYILSLAYFGMLPKTVPLAVMLCALTVLFTGGRLRSAVPVMVVIAVVFVTVAAVSPGENQNISRFDEQMRDKLAFSTVSIEGNELAADKQEQNVSGEKNGGSKTGLFGSRIKNNRLLIIIGLIILTALILFIPAVIHDRLEKKRRKNRAGIDSKDPREAIRAMFPYAVRWLKESGVQTGNVPFASLKEDVRGKEGEAYSGRYSEMLKLWKEAAYSDHALNEDNKNEMKSFMNDTIEKVRGKLDLKGRLRVRFRTAL